MRRRPVAVLDTNVLFPFQLRNLLLHLAAEDVYVPLWSREILNELARVLGRDAKLTEPQRVHLIRQMETYFPDALGAAPGDAADGFPLPDEDDRHVIALAAHYEADVIVTSNLRHFPASALERLGLEARHPDEFCLNWQRSKRRLYCARRRHTGSRSASTHLRRKSTWHRSRRMAGWAARPSGSRNPDS